MNGTILIVEDKQIVADLLNDYLLAAGFNTRIIDHEDEVIT